MRYLPLTNADRKEMLAAIGVANEEGLFADVPAAALLKKPVALPVHQPEFMVEAQLSHMAAKNKHADNTAFFIGGGIYNHHIPATADYIIQRGEFLTSYTPYQPEVSQGTLQYLFEFQTQVARLTGMGVANASLYDGSTACVEAIMMAGRVTKRHKTIVSGGLHPHYREVAQTYAKQMGFSLDCLPAHPSSEDDFMARLDDSISCVVVQYPDVFGRIHDYRALAQACHAKGIMVVAVVTEIVALGALEPPAAWGADIVAAEGQSLGVPMGFGGPHVGLFACQEQHLRQMPGRLCGQTVDAEGKVGYVLTLSTREQHIRRDKATSNICTNSGLCALAFSIHLSLLGEEGYKKLAALNHAKACQLADALTTIKGVRVVNSTFFNEFTVDLGRPAAPIVEALVAKDVLAGIPLSRLYPHQPELANYLLVAATELTTDAAIDQYSTALKGCLS